MKNSAKLRLFKTHPLGFLPPACCSEGCWDLMKRNQHLKTPLATSYTEKASLPSGDVRIARGWLPPVSAPSFRVSPCLSVLPELPSCWGCRVRVPEGPGGAVGAFCLSVFPLSVWQRPGSAGGTCTDQSHQGSRDNRTARRSPFGPAAPCPPLPPRSPHLVPRSHL